ncbi:histone chaperone ASF1-like [Eurytemora carolleeae]|uniref:histone chaperone ASF1-like n=1 Tax=Eurytemora carolleeae TaxID=1294199 RepID=UPI000C78DB24|nr:histone chaperone ASF1-like [Eurytemora carolleeae]|eukprot:XP_023347869.1 histone chaperone ASF1-like [Eurytemora affinis]
MIARVMGHTELVHNRDYVKFNDVYGRSVARMIRTDHYLDKKVTDHLNMFVVNSEAAQIGMSEIDEQVDNEEQDEEDEEELECEEEDVEREEDVDMEKDGETEDLHMREDVDKEQVKSSSSRPHQSTCSSAETGTFDDEENLSEVKSSTAPPHQSTCSSAETGTFDEEQNLSEIKRLASRLQQSTSTFSEVDTSDDEYKMPETIPLMRSSLISSLRKSARSDFAHI